jgi:hypothetical protein
MVDSPAIRERFVVLSPHLDERGRRSFAKPLVSYRVIVDLISATTTDTALTVRCELDTNAYPKAIVVPDCERDAINLFRDAFHGEWNYKLDLAMIETERLIPDGPLA